MKFNEIKNGFKSWTEIANDVLATYEKLKPTNDIPDSQER